MAIKPLKIGPLQISFPFILAPMAGYTHLPYREICSQQGAGLSYTELTVAEGVARRLPPTMIYLETSPINTPVGAHIYGSSPDSMARAAQVIESLGTFCLIDINCGCPVRKVTSKGAGAALIQTPERVYDMVSAMKSATDLPITVKTRMGYTPNIGKGLAVIQAAQSAGAAAVTIHARYASERHKGPADWTALKQLKQATSIPLIGNGGADNAESALRMLQETGVDAVMIGRAALGNPWLFEQIKARSHGTSWTAPSLEEKEHLIMNHARRTIEMMERVPPTRRKRKYTPEQAACRLFRAHLTSYFAGQPGMRHIMLDYLFLESLEQIQHATRRLLYGPKIPTQP